MKAWLSGSVAFLGMFVWPNAGIAEPSSPIQSRVEAALTNIMTLNRPGEDGFATVWDGNKYVQCRFTRDRQLRCEAAGALLQPSLSHILAPERIARLTALGWRFDPSFGNYVQNIPSDWPASQIADKSYGRLPKDTTPSRQSWRSEPTGLRASRARRAMARVKTSPA